MKNGWLYPAWGNLVLMILSIIAFAVAAQRGEMGFAALDAISAALNLAIYQWKTNENSKES